MKQVLINADIKLNKEQEEHIVTCVTKCNEGIDKCKKIEVLTAISALGSLVLLGAFSNSVIESGKNIPVIIGLIGGAVSGVNSIYSLYKYNEYRNSRHELDNNKKAYINYLKRENGIVVSERKTYSLK